MVKVKALRVIIVDDSEIIRAVVGALLSERGHVVVELDDPRRIGAEIATSKPDLVLVDLSFPEDETLHVAQVMQSEGRGVPLVVFSDRPDSALEAATARLGAAGFLRKSTGSELAEGVEAFAAAHRPTPSP